ncbi:MAG: response regulator transcription factor [Opitutaceae bacterium]|nr:response regulator transcription factor [Opitutaceae bacterium]
MNSPLKILLVDDEVHVRKYIGMLLKSIIANPELFEAGNSYEAQKLFQEHAPDLVFLDINMPGRDGLETLGDLRGLNQDVGIIMLTSVSARGSVQKALENGADGYILKDTPAAEIKEQVAALIAELQTPDGSE